VTSTPDCFAVTSGTAQPLPNAAARDRFLALVAETRAAVQAALTASTNEYAGDGRDPATEPSGHAPRGAPTDGTNPSPAQRLERVVSKLFTDTAPERAEVRVVD
jgi:hypothetical protein